jgi:hypothetical protein
MVKAREEAAMEQRRTSEEARTALPLPLTNPETVQKPSGECSRTWEGQPQKKAAWRTRTYSGPHLTDVLSTLLSDHWERMRSATDPIDAFVAGEAAIRRRAREEEQARGTEAPDTAGTSENPITLVSPTGTPAPGMHPGSPWVEYKGGRSSILLSDEEGRQQEARYMRFDVVEQEPVITGTMGQGHPQNSASLFATPCYDVPPAPRRRRPPVLPHPHQNAQRPRGGGKTTGRLQRPRGSISRRGRGAKLAKVRARRTHLENAALAFSRAWAALEGETADAEGERDQSYGRLGAAKVRSRVKELWHTAIVRPQDGGISHEAHDFWEGFIIKEIYRAQEGPEDGSPGVSPRPGVFGGFCQWCSWGGHGSDECTDPHFHCTRGRGCIVPREHPNWETRHRCMASPEWEGNRRTN